MAVNPQQELIWQGRLQLGDEPGVYGDAAYSGLGAEMPVTVFRLDPNDTTPTTFKFVLETEGLETFTGFPGHDIAVSIYEPDPNVPDHFVQRILVTDHFTGADHNRKEISTSVPNVAGPFRLSVLLRCDPTVMPGLYDDFVWIRLSLVAENFAFFASLGFSN